MRTVEAKVNELGTVLSELARLHRNPANAADFARHEAALSTALTKHQLICAAIRCTDQSFANSKENARSKN
jgi:hypothetical protein